MADLTIKMHCPTCGSKLRSSTLFSVATNVARRKCKCGANWQIKVTPLKSGNGIWIHQLDWMRLLTVREQ